MRGIVIGLLCVRLFATCMPDPSALKEARSAYYAGSEGNDNEREHATKAFAKMHAACADNPVVLAYWGSLQLLEAAHTWALWRKNSLSKDGIQALDRAVAAAPENLEVRFVRAVTTYNLPGIFHRREQSKSDFAFLSQHAEQAVREGRLEPSLGAASLYYHAQFLHDAHDGQAVEYWKRAIRLAPSSRAARESASELKRYQ